MNYATQYMNLYRWEKLNRRDALRQLDIKRYIDFNQPDFRPDITLSTDDLLYTLSIKRKNKLKILFLTIKKIMKNIVIFFNISD